MQNLIDQYTNSKHFEWRKRAEKAERALEREREALRYLAEELMKNEETSMGHRK